MLTYIYLNASLYTLNGISEHFLGPSLLSSVYLLACEVNNYIVRSYRDVIVVANIVSKKTSKA